MIVLDTNVISTLLSDPPDDHVRRWLDMQPLISVWTTSVTLFEIRLGLELLPRGRRRTGLEASLERILESGIGHRVLAFDERAARSAAEFAVRRQRASRPVDPRDTMIAGIVIAHRGTLATRNLRHFDDPELRMLDPFDPRALEPDARWVQPTATGAHGGRTTRTRRTARDAR